MSWSGLVCFGQIVIIMRGLPGSGKSHVAKLIRVSGFSDRSLSKSIHLTGLNVETLSFT